MNPDHILEGLLLKLQYFGHLIRRGNSLEKTLMLGKIEGKRRRGQQSIKWIDSITNSMDTNLSKLWEIVENRGAWSAIVYGVTKSQTQLSDLATYPLLTVQGQKAVLSEVIQAPGLLLWLVCSFLGCDPLLHGGSSCPLLSPYHSLYRWEQLLYASFLTSHLL